MSTLTLAISASEIWSKVWTILFAILFFGVIIAIHEFGHFITAKLFKVKVNEFAIGMGPKIIKKQKGETLYSLRLLPIGGFCALEGEDNADPDDPRAFGNQKKWKKLIILAAGATLNIILGLILVCVMLGMDGVTGNTVISTASEQIMGEENAIKEGDRIISVDGGAVFTDNDLYYSIYRKLDDYVELRTGDELEEYNETDHDDYSNLGYFDIKVKRDGKTVKLENVAIVYDTSLNRCSIISGQKDITVLNIIPSAVSKTCSMARLIWLSLVDMVSGQYGLKDLSGPVGTISMVAEETQTSVEAKDYSSIIFLLAFITINIGIMNLLPLPALDGGRIFFVLIEIIIRRPVPKKFEAVVHAAGFVLLMLLMAVITVSDIIKL